MYSEAQYPDAKYPEAARANDTPARAVALTERLQSVQRFLGGAPGLVLGKLAVLSIAVGALLSSVRLNPVDLFFALLHAANTVYAFAAGIVGAIVYYFLIGIIVVAPIWLILRFFGYRQERAEDPKNAATRW